MNCALDGPCDSPTCGPCTVNARFPKWQRCKRTNKQGKRCRFRVGHNADGRHPCKVLEGRDPDAEDVPDRRIAEDPDWFGEERRTP